MKTCRRLVVFALVWTLIASTGWRTPVRAQEPSAPERFLLRAPASEVEAIAARHNLTVIAVLNGHDLYLVERANTSNTEGSSGPPDLSAEPGSAIERNSPTRVLETGSDLQLNESTVGILDTLPDRSPVTYFGSTVWSGYANQPAASLIRLPETHARFGAGTGTIAVIDTGVDPTHPMLAPVLVPGYDFIRNAAGIPSEWLDLDPAVAEILKKPALATDTSEPAQLNESTVGILDESTVGILDAADLPGAFGHGTMVAGLVRLTAPNARIMPLKAFRPDGTGSVYDVVRAVYYAVDHGANVISMSFGVADPSPELMRAINYATAHGVICVGSAGNAGREVLAFPASFGNVIGVGSTSLTDQDSEFSNFGDAIVRIAAPGEQLITAYPGNHYAAASGTSFSTALISGGMSLLLQATPGMTPTEAAEFIRRGAVKNQNLKLGQGRVDLFEAMRGRGSSPTGTAANAAPSASNDLITTNEDTQVVIDVLSNDSDANGDALSVASVLQPANGTAVIATTGPNAGKVVYKPRANFSGIDSFAYVITDGMLTAPAVVMVTVNSVNDAPVLVEDSASTDEDTAVVINVLANDTDSDGETLTISGVTPPANGTVSVVASGIRYVPNANYSGADSFTYTATDGAAMSTGVVTLTVRAVNDPPVATADTTALGEDSTITINVIANDQDADGDTVTVKSITQPAHGVATLVAAGADAGRITYTPAPDFAGTDTFTYTIDDGHASTAIGTVTLTVSPANDAPVAAGDAATTAEDTAVTVDVLANDKDVDSDAITVTAVGTPANGTATVLTGAEAGRVRYTPKANFVGHDSVSYTISDGHGGTATAVVEITVTPVNDDPVAVADTTSTTEDNAAVVDVLANDNSGPDAGETLSVTAVSQPTHGTAAIVATGADAGKVSYKPNANYVGNDTFTYTIGDGHGGTATAAVSITISNVNDAPVAANDAVTTLEDSGVTIDALGNDSDVDGDTITVTSVGTPANGTITILTTGADAGRLRYTPNANFVGRDTVSYTVEDGHGGSATAVVTVDVTGVNDNPVATPDVAAIAEDAGAAIIDVLANDSSGPDVGETLAVTAVSQPAHGAALLVASGADAGKVSYTPHADFAGSDAFTYTISDGQGGTAVANVSVSVTSVNDLPVARADNVTTAEDSAITIDVLANDTDIDGDTVTVASVGTPAHGTVTLLTAEPDAGRLRYTPNANFAGADSVSYTIDDGHGGTATAVIALSITAVNDEPTASPDVATVAEDTTVVIDVLANDSVGADAGETLTITAVSQPAHGSVAITAGKLTYTPNAEYSGADAFTYTVDDGNGGSANAGVTVSVTSANDAPTAVPDAATTAEDTSTEVNVRGNDSDIDGDTLTVAVVGAPANGTASITETGSVRYTPNPNFAGADHFSYTIEDGHGGSATGNVALTITPVNDEPVAAADVAVVPEDAAVVIDVLANDSLGGDAGETLSITAVTPAAHGSATIVAGKVSYAPHAEYSGSDAFTYTVSDGNGGTATATVTLTVTAGNDAPIAVADSATTAEDTPVEINVRGNDSDVDGDALTVTVVSAPANGTATITETGSVRYAPTANFAGADSFSYRIEDGQGGTATANVALNVTAVNDEPSAAPDVALVPEDAAVVIDVLANDNVAGDAGETLSITAVSSPAHGSATIVAGKVSYVPTAEYSGSDAFTYTVDDGNGGTATAPVTVTVTAGNDAPMAVADAATTTEDTPIEVNVRGNDSDIDGDALTVSAVGTPANGEAVITGTGSVRYSPHTNFAGVDTVSYTITDVNGATSNATLTVTVTAANDNPVAGADTAAVAEDGAAVIDVLANDTAGPDTGETLVVTGVSPASHGSTTIIASGDDAGKIAYTPNPDYAGADSFTYTIADGNGGTATAGVTLAVTSVNDVPVAMNDSASVAEDGTTVIDVRSNDTDREAGVLTVAAVTQPAHGVAVVIVDGPQAGSVAYTPAAGFAGSDTFNYTLADEDGATSFGSVTIAVTAVNDAPVAENDLVSATLTEPATFDVLANDSDLDGDTLALTGVTTPGNGTAQILDGGRIIYTPFENFIGTDSFTYSVADGQGGTASATVFVSVQQ